MKPLPEPPTAYCQLIGASMRQAARLIIKLQSNIDTQINIATPDGDWHLAVTLPKSGADRRTMLRRISALMAWKQTVSFIMSGEIEYPDAVYALGVSRSEAHACMARVKREPRPWTAANIEAVEWLEAQQIAPELLDLLPTGARSITLADIDMIDKWFGPRGKFPVVRVAGELRVV